jgi:hypothetical protein
MYIITASTTFIFIGLYADKKLATTGPIYVLIIFLFACSYFGIHVYPAIPPHLGGARPYIATLTVKPDYAKALTQMGFVVTNNSQIEKTSIAYDDTDTIVVQNGRGYHAISRQAFVAISNIK